MEEKEIERLGASLLSSAKLEIENPAFTHGVMDAVFLEATRRSKRKRIVYAVLVISWGATALAACILMLGRAHIDPGDNVLADIGNWGRWILDQAYILCPLALLAAAGLHFQQRFNRVLTKQQ